MQDRVFHNEDEVYLVTQMAYMVQSFVNEVLDDWNRVSGAWEGVCQIDELTGYGLKAAFFLTEAVGLTDNPKKKGFEKLKAAVNKLVVSLRENEHFLDRLDALLDALIQWNQRSYGSGWTYRRVPTPNGTPGQTAIALVGGARRLLRQLRNLIDTLIQTMLRKVAEAQDAVGN